MCSNCALRSGCFEPSSALRLNWREKPSFTSSLRTVSALIGWPIAVSVSASLSMLFDTQIRGRMGSPSVAGSTRRLSSGTSSGSVSRHRPAPATSAAHLPLRQRLRVEIVLAAIDRRAGEPRDPRHNRQTAPACGPHLAAANNRRPRSSSLLADRFPAHIEWRPRRSCNRHTPVRRKPESPLTELFRPMTIELDPIGGTTGRWI